MKRQLVTIQETADQHCKKKNALQELAQAFWTSSAKIAKLLLRTQWNTCHPKLVQARDEHSEIRVWRGFWNEPLVMYTIRTWELDMSRTLNKFYATCTGQLSLDKGVLYLLYKSEQPQLLELDHVISAQIESSKSTGACHYVIGIHPTLLIELCICPSKSL